MDLKSFREDKLKIKTQSAFAELIGVEQSSVSRWEKDPSSITFDVITKILKKTGATFDELTGWKKPVPAPLDVKDTWKNVDFTKHTILEYIISALEKLGLSEKQKKDYIEDLQKGIMTKFVKPKLAIVGRSDTGKSTLINALLGAEKMPVAWTPTTSIAIYLKHISDKPEFIEEDAWVFSNSNGNENMWNERNLYDEKYCRSWKIASGGVEILRSFGTRQGENYDKEAGSAVVFIDSPILKTCDIMDLPGFGTETENDDNITFSTAQKADVIIYLSQANGFMRIEDITYLKRNISELPVWEEANENPLPPLANLFVVASQAHTVNNGNRAQLSEILNVGCKNLLKTLPPDYWENRADVSGHQYDENGYKELRSRFFSYTTDIPEICEDFNNSLAQILKTLPEIINSRTKEFVRSYISERKPNLENEIKKYEEILSNREQYVILLEAIDENELKRVKENDIRKKNIRSEIDKLRTESLSEFTDYIGNTINVDSLIAVMREKGVKNKKDDVELFGSTLQSMIQSECENILKKKSEILSKETKTYITAYSESISKPFENNDLNIDFNAEWTFAAILSKLGMIGGFGTFLASSISAASLLTGLGLSLTSIFSGVAYSSIFGPIGIAFGLLVAGGLGLAKLFGGGWEKNIAKKIVSKFEEHNFDDDFRKGIKEYWNQTESAFNSAAEKLDEDWNYYVNNLRETVNSYDIEEIQRQIAILGNLSSFFDNIPL